MTQNLVAFAGGIQECANLVRLLIQRCTKNLLNRLKPRRRHRRKNDETRMSNDERIMKLKSRSDLALWALDGRIAVSPSTCFSKFWRRSDAVPLPQSRAFELAVSIPAPPEQSSEENAWFRALPSGKFRCFSESPFWKLRRLLRRS